MRLLLTGAACAIGAAALTWGCGGGNGNPASPSSGAPALIVNIVASTSSSAYSPNPVPANGGDNIGFKNNTGDIHHIVLDDGSADFGDLMPGQTSKGFTVKAGGTTFHCLNHSSMVGAINAQIPEPPPCMTPGYC